MIRAIRQQFDAGSLAPEGRAVGERALMRAVLEDAIQCLAAETGPTGKRSRLAAEARAWVADDDLQSPFSFANLCDALGFNCETLRARLLTSAPILLPLDTAAVGAIEVARPTAPNDLMRVSRGWE
jgi:hypothetical protein